MFGAHLGARGCSEGCSITAIAAATLAPPRTILQPWLRGYSLTCSLHCTPLSQANRAHTYLGKREAEWHDTKDEADIYPNFVLMAQVGFIL
jgi:hypothetical protein